MDSNADDEFERRKTLCLSLCRQAVEEVGADVLRVGKSVVTKQREFSTKATVRHSCFDVQMIRKFVAYFVIKMRMFSFSSLES